MKAKALLKEILNTDYTLQYREKLIKEFAEAACKEPKELIINESEIYKTAMKKWGLEPQLDMVIEECSELTQAISKLKRNKADALSNVLEEIGDVEIMLSQMRYYFNGNLIDDWKRKKLETLKKMLGIK